jgi:hypothetical protein
MRKRQISDKDIELHVQELAEKAGFVLWEDELWGLGKGKIDWSSDYEKELIQFYKLAIEEAYKELHPMKVSE